MPLFYPYTAGPVGRGGLFIFFNLDCTPDYLAQAPNAPREFHPVSEAGQLLSSTSYQFVIPGVQAASPTTEQPEATLTVRGSAITHSEPGNQVVSVTMTEVRLPLSGATAGSRTRGVKVTVVFDKRMTSCTAPGAFGLGLRVMEMDCRG